MYNVHLFGEGTDTFSNIFTEYNYNNSDNNDMKKEFNKNKNLISASRKTKTMYLDACSSNKWSEIAKKVEALLRKI